MKHKIFSALAIALACVIGLFFGACNQKTPDVANALLSDTVSLHGFSANPSVVGTAYRRFAQFNDGTLFLGKSGTTEAVSFVRFMQIPDSLGALTEADIVSATLSMQPLRYVLGDSIQNRLKINVVELLKPYLDTTIADQITPEFFDAKVAASIDAQIPLKDSVAPIEISFDKSVIVKWLKRKQQYKNDTLTWGIALRDNGSSVIRRFSTPTISNPNAPHTMLRIVYRQPGGGTLDTMTWHSGGDATFTYAPLGGQGVLLVHGAVAVDGLMSFDISSLPAGIAVHLAKLTLTLDPSRTIVGNMDVDSLIGARFIDSSNLTNLAHDYFGYYVKDKQKYVFPLLNSAVDGMIKRGGKGVIVVRPVSQYDMNQCNRLVFWDSSAPDTTARPLLEVIYSTRPKLQP